MSRMRVIELNQSVTASNDKDADNLRKEMHEAHILLLNLMSSPGSGKTTLLSRIITDMKNDLRIGVMEADIASDVDALKIEALGAKALQAHTDGMCHMDAGMTRRAYEALEGKDLDIIFLENVGNLICPAEFDTGASLNMMILSVPEGDDKPLKYPLMFEKSDVLVVTKMDTLDYFDFDLEKVIARVKKLNPSIKIFPISAKTGQGMQALEDFLQESFKQWTL
ncbi:MAG TPA: hydrogenase accessory protein HypB [Erysipelotrichaceae bacterium]|nr:hydrogenase accessory protein HypB [Erysipelotrichaceae bacterium]HAV17836.1 hydrogenase accessory protein HypB [Erysipelotrichaceae bacterium]HBG85484.1 hydrogenase accessory protein HypB [Erysipelotrichaceae bacterium]HBZ88692.1 hydrogenase accessory protein HypB [Erysipelotrichaceae bacterium]HCG97467.1 hydrogenase accessory protein HypB [Erysipelotrichaceae bacterium]